MMNGRVAQCERDAAAGNPDAMFQLAIWRLTGDPLPRDLGMARTWLARARSAGHTDAALIEVALVANGSGGDPDWTQALELLRAAATRNGGESAASDLALIEAMRLSPDGSPGALPSPQRLSTSPDALVWRGFLSPQECAHVAMSVRDILEPSMVADPRTGRLVAHPVRRSSIAPIGPTRASLPIQAIERRIAAATGTDVRQGESLNVLHYAPGQEYRMHLDTLPQTTNQRISTMILYLNDAYEGGETRFEGGVTMTAHAGDALWFASTLADGTPDPASRHAGAPVLQGAKWIATRWIRAHAFDTWLGPEAAQSAF